MQFQNVWEDDFSDEFSGWPRKTGEGSYWEWGYQGSHYYVLIKEPGHSVNFIQNDTLREYSDFIVAVDSWLEPGNSSGGYAIIFHNSQNPRGFFRFSVSTEGNLHIQKLANGESSFPIFFTESPHIKKGGQVNRLMIKCRDSKIEVYINGALVASFEDDSLRKGSLGLDAINASKDKNVRILFDNFYLVW